MNKKRCIHYGLMMTFMGLLMIARPKIRGPDDAVTRLQTRIAGFMFVVCGGTIVIYYYRKTRVSTLRVRTDQLGICVERYCENILEESRTAPWSEIRRIMIFKRDLFSCDLICMLIVKKDSTLPAHEALLELNEEMEGWAELLVKIHEYLPSSLPSEQWFLNVISPAFEPTPVTIYTTDGKA